MADEEIFDLLVIGAGPAGLSAAAEWVYHSAGSVAVLEKGPTHNQTVQLYYPAEKRVDAAYRGQEAICAGVLCFRDTTKTNFLGVVDQMLSLYPFPIHYGINVDSIRKNADGVFSVSTTEGQQFWAKALAIGIGRMGKPNRPEFFSAIPASVRRNVQFDVSGINNESKEILVIGGGNSAVEFALSLSGSRKVTLSYRKEVFSRLNPMNQSLLSGEERAGHLRVLRNSNLIGIKDAGGRPLVCFEGGTEEFYDRIIFAIGGSSPAAFLQNAGIEVDEKGNPKLTGGLETSVDHLYVVGELSVPQGKGSIIASFNSGKVAIEHLMNQRKLARKSEQNFLA